MFDWSFWKGFIAGGALVTLALLKGATAIKALWPSRAKPQLLEEQECIIDKYGIKFSLVLLVDNSAGSKDCSVTSVELILVKGYPAEPLKYDDSTLFPKTIMAGRAEPVVFRGYCTKLFRPENKGKTTRLNLQPEQKSLEGEVTVKFNTGKIIKKKITFIIGHP